jgi:uncharacterized protein YndB with AHSA1/START domain
MSTRTSTSRVVINAPAERVWQALTEPALVKQWQYGSDLLTDWSLGGPLRFHSEWEGVAYEQWGTVLEVVPHLRLVYTLFAPRPDLEDKPENYFTMTYGLEEADRVTTLTISQDDPRPAPAQDESASGGTAEGGEEGDNAEDADDGSPVLNALKDLVERGW